MPLSSRHPIAAAALAALLAASTVAASSASAQTAPTPGAQPAPQHRGPWGDPAAMQRRADQRLARLKERLQISPAQEGSWSAFSGAMRPGADGSVARGGFDRAEFAKLTTPERIDRMRALRAQHQVRADQRADAVKTFYASLSPQQQRIFDSQPMPHGGRGHMGGHGPRAGERPPAS